MGKSELDAHILDCGPDRQFNNDKSSRRNPRNWLLEQGVSRAVFEPTGRYHHSLRHCLSHAGLETVLVNPLRSRRFAQAIGQFANNDRVDAAMLARFGLLAGLESAPALRRNLQQPSDLLALRRKLVEQPDTLRKLCVELGPRLAATAPSTAACST